jgi:hypothetical protein
VPGVALVGWCAYVWLTVRSWTHRRRRRWVTRPVRAVGNWLASVIAVALYWRPLAVASVLAAAGGALVVTALVARHRPAAAPGGPIRAQVHVPQPLRTDGR